MWVGSRDEDACDEKADSCDRAAEFWKAGASGVKGCHVENPSWVFSRKLAIGLIGSLFSSKASKLEMTGFQSAKAAFASLSFSSEFGVNV